MYLPGKSSLRGLGLTLPDLAAAITRMEGSCSSPGVCVNNNPGNLRAYAAGQPVDSRGIRIFATYQDGYNALLSQEQLNIRRGLTLSEFFGGKAGVYAGYAPSGDANDPGSYSWNVASWLGISPDVPLSSLLGDSSIDPPTSEGGGPLDTLVAPDGSLSGAAWLGLGLGAIALVWAVS